MKKKKVPGINGRETLSDRRYLVNPSLLATDELSIRCETERSEGVFLGFIPGTFFFVRVLFFLRSLLRQVVKQKADGPDSGQSDQCVHNAADNGIHAAEQPGNQVKLENTDQPPVDSADDQQCQSYFIQS